MGVPPMDVCTHTLDAQRRTQSRSDLPFWLKVKSRYRGELIGLRPMCVRTRIHGQDAHATVGETPMPL